MRRASEFGDLCKKVRAIEVNLVPSDLAASIELDEADADDLDNGVVISAILQREQARVYAKPIVAGRSSLELSPEEIAAMDRARRGPAVDGGG